ncbi:hypothetical protein R5R35_013067 [Gryllus longicercus]|uniref:Uncharacterized protein n=1 Tax=Gryllus longicercus TaxID=2509291 RepID=A0AAN9YZJ2_9ORTH
MDNKQRPKGNPTLKNYEAAAKDRKIAALRKKPEKEIEDAVIKLQKSYSDKQSARTCAQLESNKLLETSHINEKIIMELELDEENEVYLGNEICKTVEDEWHNLRLHISALNVLHDEKREDFQALNIRELENLISMTKSRIIDEFKRQRKLVKELERQNNQFKHENINKNKEEEWEQSLADMFQELDESYELFTNKTYTSIQIFYTVQLYRYMECHNIHVRKMLLELKRNREILKDYFNDILERDIAVICDMQARVNYIIGGPKKVRNIKDLRKMKKKEQELKNKVQEVRINMDLLLRRLDSFHRAVQQIHVSKKLLLSHETIL